MSTPRCARCGAAIFTETEYVLNGRSHCAFCYGLALAAGRDVPAVPSDAEGMVRIDPTADDAGGDSAGPSDAGHGRDPPDAQAIGRSVDLLPVGFTLASRCRPQIDDASIRPPDPADWGHPAVQPRA